MGCLGHWKFTVAEGLLEDGERRGGVQTPIGSMVTDLSGGWPGLKLDSPTSGL